MNALFASGGPGSRPHFHIGPVPVRIELSFWLIAVVLGLNGGTGPQLFAWVAIVFASVLVHELGHAFAYVSRGAKTQISLYGGGGLTWGRRDVPFKVGEQIFVSIAGPAVGLVLGGVVYLVAQHVELAPLGLGSFVVEQLIFVNVAWGIFNLMPVLPMDGGHVMEALFTFANPTHGRLWARYASVALAVLIGAVIWFAPTPLHGNAWPLMLLALFAFQSIQTIPLVDPKRQAQLQKQAPGRETPPAETPDVIENLARLHKLLAEDQPEQARAVAHQVLSAARGTGARDQALRALAWLSIGSGNATEALGYLAKTSPRFDDPLTWGTAIAASGDAMNALPHLARAYQRSPDAQTIATYARCLAAVGRADEARRLATLTSPIEVQRALAEALFRSRDFTGSAEISRRLFEYKRDPHDAYNLACAESRLGLPDDALKHLRAAVEAGFQDRAHLEEDPDLASLRARTEWTEILGSIGTPSAS